MKWKEFKDWMESKGVTDDMEYDSSCDESDVDIMDMGILFDKRFGDNPIVRIVYK